ncbi:MAG: hypothetical protein O7E52_20110 [Candidatus Poribacteria bacterium]|nr:hypothetical protein [Candidatus Poribacteria bacterium]
MDMLDVRGLPNDKIEFIQQLIEFMRQKHQKPLTPPEDETETIHLRSWSLGVKGEISREEIYDYLDEREDGAR